MFKTMFSFSSVLNVHFQLSSDISKGVVGRPVLSQYYNNKNVATVCFIGDWLESKSKEGVNNHRLSNGEDLFHCAI